MRNLTIILILITLFGCNQKTEKSETHVAKFERFLGEQETIFLNEIVVDFDDYLQSKYPDHKSKFKLYLLDISESKVNDFWRIDSIKSKKFNESNLFGKYEKNCPDSVWFNGQTFYIKYSNDELIEEINPINRNNVNLNIDSMIKSLKAEPRLLLKENSKIYLALESIKQSDSLILTYLDTKVADWDLSSSSLAGGLKYYLTEHNEYFAKRIFILEMYEK